MKRLLSYLSPKTNPPGLGWSPPLVMRVLVEVVSDNLTLAASVLLAFALLVVVEPLMRPMVVVP